MTDNDIIIVAKIIIACQTDIRIPFDWPAAINIGTLDIT
jgi:hypothetical protein